MKGISQETFEKIRKIQINTTQLANDIMAGAWHSAFKGQGMEFEEVREYHAGDDIRSIDWNVTARMDRPYVKVFREERELTVILLVDVSSSTRFGSHDQLKRDLIAEVGAVLAFSAIKNNDNIGLVLFSGDIEKYVPPKKGTRHVLRVIRELLAYEPKHPGTDMDKALTFLGKIQRRTAICFLLSDFLCPLPAHDFTLIAKKHDLISIAITNPYERDFPNMEMVKMEDLESGHMEVIDTSDAAVATHFKTTSAARLKNCETLMNKIGAGFMALSTDEPYLKPMRKFFKLREIKH